MGGDRTEAFSDGVFTIAITLLVLVTDEDVRAVTLATVPNIGFYVTATIVAIFWPRGAAAIYLAISVLGVFRARGDEPVPAVAAS